MFTRTALLLAIAGMALATPTGPHARRATPDTCDTIPLDCYDAAQACLTSAALTDPQNPQAATSCIDNIATCAATGASSGVVIGCLQSGILSGLGPTDPLTGL
ncbi:hypothetical protein PsYK624_151230 [Phanerochaete sordida]|uniref:Extracellular membrane protein CFEM domain-containing protein n=1 Tax=Phanerochaete sordida TaxID=48140 RepID=A0A9P3GPP1_9APHY|nr:hypothetical protein PsYK624_151230 [Phanerochaete sordida]